MGLWKTLRVAFAICVLAIGASAPAARSASWQLDHSFGADGVAQVSGGRFWSLLAPGPQGSLYVGAGARGHSRSFLITRLSARGRTVASFGSGGVASVPAVASQGSPQMFVLGDGDLLVSGSDSAGHFALTRLTPRGRVDRAFGHDGVAQYTLPDVLDTAQTPEVAVEPDGDILAAYQDFGSGEVGPGERPGPVELLRLTPSGALDRSFGKLGFLALGGSLPTTGYISGMSVAADGSILLAYDEARTRIQTFGAGVLELSAAGVPVASFGSGGYALIPSSYGIEGPDLTGLFALPGGVVEAAFLSTGSAGRTDLFRFLAPTGAPDPAFGSAGEATVASGALAVAVGADGETFIAGFLDGAMLLDGVLADGAADPALGGGGGARFTPQLPAGANEKEVERVLAGPEHVWVLLAGLVVEIARRPA